MKAISGPLLNGKARMSRLVVMALFACSLMANAGMPYTDAEVLRAFEEVTIKGVAASARSQVLAFKYNDRLNLLRLENKISDRIFQANQTNFERINDNFIGRAAAQNNMVHVPQKPLPGKLPTPMSDTDAILKPVAGSPPLTAAQIDKANADYQRMVKSLLSKHGVSVSDAAMPDTNTSLMPDPRNMTRAEWDTWNAGALKRGEVIYKNPVAAIAEAKIRAGETLNAYEAASRVREMQRLATDHFQAAEKLDAASRQASATAQHAAARKLQLQAQAMRQNAAKYITRIHDTGQYMSAKAGLTPTGQPPSDALKQAAVRGHQSAAQAKALAQQSQQLLDQANQSFLDNMSHVATRSKDPALVNQAKRNMARLLNEMPSEQRTQALEAIARKNGQPLAREMERTMRTLPKGKPSTVVKAPPSKLETAAKTLSTAMVIYQGVTRMTAVRDAKDFAEQFVELPADKQAEIIQQLSPEQRDSLDEAIARIDDPVYQEQMRKAGFIPQWHTAAQSEEAGRQLGGFTGGYVGSKIGIFAGMKLGAGAGTLIGGPLGTVVGGTIGLAVGVTGYMVGNYVGTSVGDTRSGWWDHNLPDEEFNRRAIATGGMTPKEVFDRLVARGLDQETALEVAMNYRNGSIEAFASQVRTIREHFEEMERRAEENQRRADDHRIAQEFFEDAWSRTERQEREHERRVEASYDEWADYLAGLPPEERRQAAVQEGLTDEQRAELDRRIAERPDAAQVAPSTAPPGPVPDDVEMPAIGAVYGQTVSLDMGGGIRAAAPAPVPMPAAPVGQPEGMSWWRHLWDAYQLWENILDSMIARSKNPGLGGPPSDGEIAHARSEVARWKKLLREAPPEVLKELNAPATWSTEQRAFDTSGDPVAQDPSAGFLGEPSAPQASRYRFVYQSTPTLTFDPPESGDGRTRVTFERMGEIKLWAQVEETVDGATRRYETAVVTVNVSAPSLSLAFNPADGPVGDEVRVRVRTDPAVPDNLINYVWHSPASSQRKHYAANGGDIGVVPRSLDPVGFRVEARVPVHGDVIGQVSGTFQPAQPDEEPDAPSPQDLAQQLINEGYGLEQQKDIANAIDKYEQALRLVPNDGLARRIADLQATLDNQRRAQTLINEGYGLEQQKDLASAIDKYTQALRLVPNDGLARRIADLQATLDNQRLAQQLINEGYGLEQAHALRGAIEKYQQAQRIVPNDGLARRIADLQGRLARQAEQQQRTEQAALAEQQRQRQAEIARQTETEQRTAAERAAREQAAREQAARDQAAREQAARDQAAREQAARDQAAREQAAREQAAREQAARDQRAREQAAREQAARDQAARDQRAREQAARDQAAREKAAREQAAREAAQRSLTGTFTNSDRILVMEATQGSQRFRTYCTAWQLTLRQDGNRVSGTQRMTLEYPGGKKETETDAVSGTVQGNRLVLDGTSLTISPDFNTLTLRNEGQTVTFRRAR